MSRGSEARRRRRLTRQFRREATFVNHLDIVSVTDPVFAPAIYEWATRATANNPAECLICGDGARFGPGHGLPRLVAFTRAVGGSVAMAGGICATCAGRADLERAALAAFGFDGDVRMIDPACLHDGGRA